MASSNRSALRSELGLPTLRAWRHLRALTQKELAAKAGVTYPTVNAAERGRFTTAPETVRKLAKALGITPTQLQTTFPTPEAQELYERERTRRRAPEARTEAAAKTGAEALRSIEKH